MEDARSRYLSRRGFLAIAGSGATAVLIASCSSGQPSVSPTSAPAPATPAKPTTAPTVVTAPTAGPKPTTVATAASQSASTSASSGTPAAGPTLPADLAPGSPNHAKGWTTILPPLPSGVPVKPPVTITSSRRVDSSMKFAKGDTIDNNPFTRMMKYLYGVQWKAAWTWVTQDDGDQKYNLAMASNQLPDMLETVPLNIYVKMLQANMLEDITDVWNATAEEKWVKQPLEYGGGVGWSYAKVKGRIMGMPYVERAAQNDKLLWYREDWLEKVGMNVPKTMDDLAKVAKAFVKAQLGQGAKGTTIGLNACKELSDWYSSLDPVFGGYGVQPPYGGTEDFWTPQGSGLMNDNIRPQMKEALAYIHQWYADGVIPQDFFTRTAPETEKLVAANRCGLHFSPDFGAGFGGLDSIKNDPKAKWNFADIPTGATRKAKYWSNPFPQTVFAFRKNFEHVDLVIKQVNWLADLVQNPARQFYGWEGRDYVWVGNQVKVGPATSTKQFYGPVGTDGNGGTDPLRNYKQDLAIEAWAKIPLNERNAMQEYLLADPTGMNTLGRKAYLFNVSVSEKEGIKNLFNALPTPTMVAMGATLQKLVQETFIGIIRGNKPASEFDSFVNQWKQLGGDKITQEVNTWWQKQPKS